MLVLLPLSLRIESFQLEKKIFTLSQMPEEQARTSYSHQTRVFRSCLEADKGANKHQNWSLQWKSIPPLLNPHTERLLTFSTLSFPPPFSSIFSPQRFVSPLFFLKHFRPTMCRSGWPRNVYQNGVSV